MRVEAVDRKPSLEVRVETEVKAVQRAVATILAEAVAAEHVDDVPTITVEWSYRELIAQQVKISRGKVKERTDSGIGLTVVVTQVAFKVSSQAGNTPVEEALPTVCEPAIQLNLQRLVVTYRIRETVWFSVRANESVAGCRINAGLSKAHRRFAAIIVVVI